MLDWQADKYLPQLWVQIIGAGRTYAARLNFFLGVPNTMMIAVLFYNDSALVQSVFPSVYHWVAFIGFVVVPGAILADRVLLHPAQIAYNSHQNSDADRNPTHRLVEETHADVRELRQEMQIATDGGADE